MPCEMRRSSVDGVAYHPSYTDRCCSEVRYSTYIHTYIHANNARLMHHHVLCNQSRFHTPLQSPQVLRSSSPQALRSSSPQIKSSSPQGLKSSSPPVLKSPSSQVLRSSSPQVPKPSPQVLRSSGPQVPKPSPQSSSPRVLKPPAQVPKSPSPHPDPRTALPALPARSPLLQYCTHTFSGLGDGDGGPPVRLLVRSLSRQG